MKFLCAMVTQNLRSPGKTPRGREFAFLLGRYYLSYATRIQNYSISTDRMSVLKCNASYD